MCARERKRQRERERERGYRNIQNPEYRRARKRESQKGRKDRTVKTSVFAFITDRIQIKRTAHRTMLSYNENMLHEYANLPSKNAKTNLNGSCGDMIGKPVYED